SGTARTISTAAGRAPDQPARPPATPDPGIGPVTTVLGIGLFVVAGGVVVGWGASRKRQVVLIRIIGVPPGEAPDEGRAAWERAGQPPRLGGREWGADTGCGLRGGRANGGRSPRRPQPRGRTVVACERPAGSRTGRDARVRGGGV